MHNQFNRPWMLEPCSQYCVTQFSNNYETVRRQVMDDLKNILLKIAARIPQKIFLVQRMTLVLAYPVFPFVCWHEVLQYMTIQSQSSRPGRPFCKTTGKKRPKRVFEEGLATWRMNDTCQLFIYSLVCRSERESRNVRNFVIIFRARFILVLYFYFHTNVLIKKKRQKSSFGIPVEVA